ncbi:hypothetical protein Droror1_Dr00012062 [Drosera rotundifolia]
MALWVLRNNLGAGCISSLLKYHVARLNSLKSQCVSIASDASLEPGELQCRERVGLDVCLEKCGVSLVERHFLLAKGEPFLGFDSSVIKESLNVLLGTLKLPRDEIVSMLSRCPGALDHEFLKKWEEGGLDLGFSDNSPSMIMSVLEFSRRYEKEPNDYRVCVDVLNDLGLSDRTIVRVLEEFPRALSMKERELRKRVNFLASNGLHIDEVNHVNSKFPGLLGFGVEDRLKPLLDEFAMLGFSMREASQEIVRVPRILGMELGEFPLCIEFVKKLKCRVPIKEKILDNGQFGAGYAVKIRIDCLCDHGLTRRDALSILRREPRIIRYDIAEIVKKVEFLTKTMKTDVSCLVEVPEYLGVNFEKQIVPRYDVIEYLRSVGGLGFHMRLTDLIKPSRLKFHNLYVKPYPECEKIFRRHSEDAKANMSRHPTGLWKLMKPPEHHKSKDDYKNIRSFMESLV